MTRIHLKVTGARAKASVTGTLTSGMVGIPVTIEYDDAWEGLTKNLVCRCSGQDTDSTEQRAILNVGSAAVVAHEVMQAGAHLYLGLEGFRPDGELVIPTTWAMCGVVREGANTGDDLSADPTLPVWNQLQVQLEQLECGTFPQEQLEEIRACAEAAARSEENALAASKHAAENADETRTVAHAAQIYMENARTSATSAANMANDAHRFQQAAMDAATRAEEAANSFGNASPGNGVTTAQVHALDGMFRLAKYESDPTGAYAAFCDAFGITAKTLVGISAVYTGGEVAVGTALTELDGITVTATYSDGTTAVVTGYTLSGEIAEGSNAITVSYGGKTATVTVVGVASGDEEPVEPLYGRFWPPKGKVLDWNNHTWDDVENFVYTSNNAGTPTEYTNAGLPDTSFVRLDKLQGTVYIRILTKEQYGVVPNSFAVYANSDGNIATGGFEKIPATIYRQFGGKSQTMEIDGKTYYFMLFKFDIPVGQTGYFVSTQDAMRSGHFISADLTGIDDAYKPYYTLFGFDPSDRITEPATEVA